MLGFKLTVCNFSILLALPVCFHFITRHNIDMLKMLGLHMLWGISVAVLLYLQKFSGPKCRLFVFCFCLFLFFLAHHQSLYLLMQGFFRTCWCSGFKNPAETHGYYGVKSRACHYLIASSIAPWKDFFLLMGEN